MYLYMCYRLHFYEVCNVLCPDTVVNWRCKDWLKYILNAYDTPPLFNRVDQVSVARGRLGYLLWDLVESKSARTFAFCRGPS